MVYRSVVSWRYRRVHAHIPQSGQIVIAVGGITAGGSGKTVVVKAIAQFLTSMGYRVAILSRGFGGNITENCMVLPDNHSWKDVGDEPLMLAQYFPVFVGKNRAKSAQLAGDNFDILIMDDGLTQRYLRPHIQVLVIDTYQGLGNGRMLPLGPNRLSITQVLPLVDGVILLGDGSFCLRSALSSCAQVSIMPRLSLFREIPYTERLPDNTPIIAFCGIGYPDKFFNSLKGYPVVEQIVFPDHHPYTDCELEQLKQRAIQAGARLVTTEKDFIKIKGRLPVTFLPLTLNLSSDFKIFLTKYVASLSIN